MNQTAEIFSWLPLHVLLSLGAGPEKTVALNLRARHEFPKDTALGEYLTKFNDNTVSLVVNLINAIDMKVCNFYTANELKEYYQYEKNNNWRDGGYNTPFIATNFEEELFPNVVEGDSITMSELSVYIDDLYKRVSEYRDQIIVRDDRIYMGTVKYPALYEFKNTNIITIGNIMDIINDIVASTSCANNYNLEYLGIHLNIARFALTTTYTDNDLGILPAS